jgi:hypothetical protein
MAETSYYTIPIYSPTRLAGKKLAKQTSESTVFLNRLVALSLDNADSYENLGEADWETIISNNEDIEPLLNAIKGGLVRVWLTDVEVGQRSFLTSADYLTEIAEDFAGSREYEFLLTYSESPKYGGVNLTQNVVVLLNNATPKWTQTNMLEITPYTKKVLNQEDDFYTVKTDFGLTFIVGSASAEQLFSGVAEV